LIHAIIDALDAHPFMSVQALKSGRTQVAQADCGYATAPGTHSNRLPG
jgi:hypothetical protein